MGERRGRSRTTLRALRVRGPVRFDASVTQQGIPRHPYREYIAGLTWQEDAEAPEVVELRNHWQQFQWSHDGAGLFVAQTNIAAAGAQLITLPLTPFFDSAGVLIIPAFAASIDVNSQTWVLSLRLFKLDASPHEPSDFSIILQVRSYE